MKKIMALAFALFFAVANAAETYVASEKITQQVLSGELTQTVYAGDEIKPITILYENTGLAEDAVPEYSSTNFLENFGLSKRWIKGPACEIAGEMRDDISAGTYTAFIVVKDADGKFAKTEFKFTVLEKEETLSLKWNKSSGDVNQEVTAGKSITPIVFDYEGLTSYSVSGLPSGLVKNIDEKKHKIMIVGSVNSDVMSGDYEYKVTVKNDQGDEKSLSGTIVVKSGKARTSIKLVSEKARQEVLAGNEIEPVVFEFANVHVDESLSSFKFEGSLKGSFARSVEENKLTYSGTVDENLKGGLYTIRVIAIGENNNDTAFANVDVIHKSVVTSVSVVENETQTVTAGDSIEPIVFKVEHGSNLELTNFPGGYGLKKDGNTVTITGLVEENAKGPYEVVLTVTGADNNASAKATINVTPVELKFELVEGSDDQTVVAGEAITPIVYQYDHMLSAKGSGIPEDLKVEQDKEKKQVKIYGTVKSGMAAKEYVYTFEITDVHSEKTTVSGKINVLASTDNSSSSVVSSSSSAKSSSSVEESSSSVKSSSSSKKDDKSSSSSVKSSDSMSSSSSAKTQSSSSGKNDKSSSSSAKSSSSSAKSSSSEKAESSSSEKTTKIVTVAMNSVKFGYANNALTIAVPTSSMVRVQVFDLTGHLVETFAESVNGAKSISLAHLNKGNYLVRVESNSMVRIARIAVK
ncbi:T9SS type A sorting domain-containing protein [Fibrobacter sp. UWB7]|uniref:T9SS type A sorting domain-containing protein n=1 Tax=Fibrobacter sp. UWB7 TaxID=1896206 RepID=UPI00091DE3C9|nr:T9SS type A sorting domain-containing protein [Fibrobacter sp. UWB7]SHM07725.1 Por secretion system C-terminal sorting domain-containing protein [Fibrobacter sp. UWB7]